MCALPLLPLPLSTEDQEERRSDKGTGSLLGRRCHRRLYSCFIPLHEVEPRARAHAHLHLTLICDNPVISLISRESALKLICTSLHKSARNDTLVFSHTRFLLFFFFFVKYKHTYAVFYKLRFLLFFRLFLYDQKKWIVFPSFLCRISVSLLATRNRRRACQIESREEELLSPTTNSCSRSRGMKAGSGIVGGLFFSKIFDLTFAQEKWVKS